MKKIVLTAITISVLFLVVTYFIPLAKTNEVVIINSYSNVIKSIFEPKNWIKWDDDVKTAWQKDSASCHFQDDSIHHTISIEIPEKKIQITQLDYLSYQLEETKNNSKTAFYLNLVIHVIDKEGTSGLNTLLRYNSVTRYFYKIFPGLETDFADQTVKSLKSYLENTSRFYGFPIEFKQSADSIFLTKNATLPTAEMFKKMPAIFNELDSFAKAKKIDHPVNKNISFQFLNKDTVSIYAGINIDKIVDGDYLISCKQLLPGQIMVTGQYIGPFYKRFDLYKAMDKYLFEHQLIKGGSSYEKYLSPLPDSDSSIIKIELYYPLLNRIVTSATHY